MNIGSINIGSDNMMKTFAQKNWPDVADKAVAYAPNFVYMIYTPDNEIHEDRFKPCCDSSKSLPVHSVDFVVPKAQIKKPYFQLDHFYFGVSSDLKDKIIKFRIDDRENDVFRPIWSTKQHDVPIAYSIEPQHVLKPIYKENNYNIKKYVINAMLFGRLKRIFFNIVIMIAENHCIFQKRYLMIFMILM